METTNTNLEVANTILAQLGGRRFVAITGAKQFVGSANSLTFKINGKGVNLVKIELNALDLYDVTFSYYRGLNVRTVSEVSNAYAEDLVNLFESATGLYARF